MNKYGLLGEKLSHSYSPIIHKELGDYPYELVEVKPEDFENFMDALPYSGLNVTIPYKKAVIPYCDEMSEAAKAIGSVNTIIRREDGVLYGDNTDAIGFLHLLKMRNIEAKGKKALILGSGGSSLTVHHVLKNEGAKEIITVSRHGEHNYDNIHQHHDAQIIVNTTPVGMYPNNGKSPVSLKPFQSLEGVVDLIYNPDKTALLLEANMLSIPSIGGLPMLVAQAAAAAQVFTNAEVTSEKIDKIVSKIRKQTQNVVLIGMPGSGKSTIGREVATLMDRPFIDTDREVETLADKTIPEIFAEEGEAVFRDLEAQAIIKAGAVSGTIISTGGGAITRPENYAPLVQNGIIVFIERPLKKLERKGRPLSGGDLEKLLEQRLPLYEQFADYQVANTGEIHDVALDVLQLFYDSINSAI